jgi:hypothetical protein
MNIRYIKNKDIDKEHWDKIIDEAPNGRVYAYSWLLDDLTECRWDALVSDDYEYIMPLPNKSKYGIHYIGTPLSIQQLGIFSVNEVDETVFRLFLKRIPTKFKYINLNINATDIDFSKNIKCTKRPNYILDIDRPYEEIRKNYRKDAIKKLKTDESFFLEKSSDISSIINDFIRDNKAVIPDLEKKDYSNVHKSYVSALKRNQLSGCILKNEQGDTLASAVFLLSHGRAYYVMGSQTVEGRKKHASHFLIDFFIRDNCQSVKIFDFEGSAIPGVADFFKKWGSIPEYYSNIQLSKFPVNLFKK